MITKLTPIPAQDTKRFAGFRVAGAPGLFKRLLHRRESGIFLQPWAEHDCAAGFQPNLPPRTFVVSRQIALTAIVALGVLFGISWVEWILSVGFTVGLSGLSARVNQLKPPRSWAAASAIRGLPHASGRALTRDHCLPRCDTVHCTLGYVRVARGVVLILMVTRSAEIWRHLLMSAATQLFLISVPVLVLVAIAVLPISFWLYFAFGRRVYAIGGNEATAALSGDQDAQGEVSHHITLPGHRCDRDALCCRTGPTARRAGNRQASGRHRCVRVIGGTSLMGGEGSVVGVIIGAVMMGSSLWLVLVWYPPFGRSLSSAPSSCSRRSSTSSGAAGGGKSLLSARICPPWPCKALALLYCLPTKP